MNRREIVAAVPFAALAFGGCASPPAQTAAAAPPPTPPAGQPRAPVPLAAPALPMTVLATGLQFPEAPLVMKDGSVLFVEIQRKTVSRLTQDGKVEVLIQCEGGPNGLAIGPDGALYIANNGGRWAFTMRDGTNFPGGPIPADHAGGWVDRYDFKTKALTRLYDSYEGKRLIAIDDLVFDKSGNMWLTEYGTKRGEGAIYYASADGRNIKLALGAMSGSPNGIGLSPDGKLLHISMGTELVTYDIVGKGVLATKTYPNEGHHGDLHDGSFADSLKVQANGAVAVCSLSRPGGITILDKAGKEQFLGFPDRMTCNLAFGGRDMRDCWLTLSGTGRIARVRWPYAGLKAAYSA